VTGEPLSREVELGTGLRAHWLEWGADDAGLDHTVLLLHGFLDSAWGWAATVRAGLAGRFHVVAPDLRGHGDTAWIGPGGYYHFIDYLSDVDEVARRVTRGRLSVVGHSMGGSVAAYFAGTFPERVHRLAMLEGLGPPENRGEVPERVRVWLDAWRRVRERPARSYAERGTRVDADGRRRFKHDPIHVTTGPTPFRVDYAAQFWRRITCPVLMVEGERSVFRAAADEVDRRLAHFASFERALVPGAGHMMQRHQPAALAAILTAFLTP
jgi:pimeloyl-ACP methyl ester carboxylesterase